MASAAKSENVQKNECLKMIKTLNFNSKTLQKEQHTSLLHKKNEKDYEEIYEMYMKLDSDIRNERAIFTKTQNDINNFISRFKEESKQKKPSADKIHLLKNLMEQIDTSISDYKEQIHLTYEELNNEEKLLSKEIEIYEKKILAWQTISQTSDNTQKDNKKKLSELNEENNSNLLKEVIDFDNYLRSNGGHNGAWDEIDHNLFLKIRNKHKGKEGFIQELTELIATKDLEKIKQHEEWYKTYLQLQESKKQAIKKWKEEKNASKSNTVNWIEAEIQLNKEVEKELKNRFAKRNELEKQIRNKRLNEWRLEQELKRAKEIETKRREEEKQVERERRLQMEREEIRRKVLEYKQQKEELNYYIEMEELIKREAEKEVKSRSAKGEIAQFQRRDLDQLKEKMFKLKAKEAELEEKEKRLEKIKEKVQVNRDPTRLYEMTSTWKNRLNTPRSESSGPSLMTPRMVPRLAVPTWRQGV